MPTPLVIATRESRLALWQAHHVRDLLVQRSIVDLELGAGGPVDHLRAHAVAVRVLESRLRLAGPEPVVVSGDEARFLAAAGRDAPTVAEPPRPVGRLLDVRTTLAPLPG